MQELTLLSCIPSRPAKMLSWTFMVSPALSVQTQPRNVIETCFHRNIGLTVLVQSMLDKLYEAEILVEKLL